MSNLTYKQRQFVKFYLGESKGNASDAARRAGYLKPAEQGYENLRKPHIRAAIDARLDSAALTTDEILARLSDHASASLEDFIKVDKHGWSVDLAKAKRLGKLHTLRKIKEGKYGVEIELHNPLDAIEKLGRYRALFAGDGKQGDGDDDTPEPRIRPKRRARRDAVDRGDRGGGTAD